jgi:endo-1,4-beta-xylanase
VGAGLLQNDLRYAGLAARQFNLLTPETAMKFDRLQPGRDRFDFRDADRIVDFAEANGMAVHGHTLVWHRQLPDWLTRSRWSRPELIGLLEAHITTLVGRYRGRVRSWDVVNEAIDDRGKLRRSVWLDGIGPDYLTLAFSAAHRADPDALLFYNDYGAEGLGPKSDAVYDLVAKLVRQGVPIHGVGLQMHVALRDHPEPADIAANIARLSALGLRVHISEMDVRLRLPATWSDRVRQAGLYGDAMQVCLEAPRCEALVFWGVTDRFSWVPAFFPGFGEALIFDTGYQYKPAYLELRRVMEKN